MTTELAKLKKADPKLTHKEAFKKAAANWSTADEGGHCWVGRRVYIAT